MLTALVLVFIVAYAAIALEHPLKINKSASALVGAGLLWTIYAMTTGDHHRVAEELGESLMGTAQIVFFLMGAMAIVEVVDAHNGFEVITQRIQTTRLSSLMWLVGFVTFFLSSVLDNLTTTIVMISLMRKLLARHEDRLFFAGIIVIAANAGGAWSPIGDVTTTMLWIDGQITALGIMKSVLLPSMVSLLVPLAITAYVLRGQQVASPSEAAGDTGVKSTEFERNLMFFLGIGILVAVPVFKTLTHLPPFMGILFGLGILWLVGDLVHRDKEDEFKHPLTLVHALSRIDMSSLVFFVGILLALFVSIFWLAEIPKGWIEWVVGALASWVSGALPPGDLNDLLAKAGGVIGKTDRALVSSDLRARPESIVMALPETRVTAGGLVRVFGWYDNEWGFSNRMLDVARLMA